MLETFSKINTLLTGMIVNTSNPINNLLMTIDLKDISSNSPFPPNSTNNIYITYITDIYS